MFKDWKEFIVLFYVYLMICCWNWLSLFYSLVKYFLSHSLICNLLYIFFSPQVFWDFCVLLVSDTYIGQFQRTQRSVISVQENDLWPHHLNILFMKLIKNKKPNYSKRKVINGLKLLRLAWTPVVQFCRQNKLESY